jgi:predicted transcriptional regulator
MTTTTIRLPAKLKSQVARAAKRAGTTAHGFMLEAIAVHAEQDELAAGFHAEAARRFARFEETGQAIEWPEMKRFITALAEGKRPSPPVAKKVK